MLAHPFGGRPRYPTPGGCGGDPSSRPSQTQLLASREEPSHTFTQHGCAFLTSRRRWYWTRLPLLGTPRRRFWVEDTLAPEGLQMSGRRATASSSVLAAKDPSGEAEHVVDGSVIDRGSTVAAPSQPVSDAASSGEAAAREFLWRRVEKEVVEDVIHLRAAGGAAHIEVVTPLRKPAALPADRSQPEARTSRR